MYETFNEPHNFLGFIGSYKNLVMREGLKQSKVAFLGWRNSDLIVGRLRQKELGRGSSSKICIAVYLGLLLNTKMYIHKLKFCDTKQK